MEERLDDVAGLADGDVLEGEDADDVAESPHAVLVGLQVFVDENVAAGVEVEAGVLEVEEVAVGSAAGGDEDLIGQDGFRGRSVLRGEVDADAREVAGDALDPGAEVDVVAVLVALGELCADFGVFTREESIGGFEDGDFRTERAEEVGEFTGDVAAADDGEVAGEAFEMEGVVRGEVGSGVQARDRRNEGAGAPGDDDAVGGDGLVLAGL